MNFLLGLDWPLIIEVSGLLIGVLFTLWGTWSKVWVKHIRPRFRRRRAKQDILCNAFVFNRAQVALHQWKARWGAMRALILVARNCCSPWNADQPVKVTVMNEAHGDNVPRVFDRWQDWVTDPPYRQLLFDTVEADGKGVFLTTNEMAPSTLKDYYIDQGVVAAVVFGLVVSEKAELIYVSLNFGRPNISDEDKEKFISLAAECYHNPEHVRKMILEGKKVFK